MREGRQFILGFLLLVTLALSGFANVPLAYAEEGAEAVVDATGDVNVDEPEVAVDADEAYDAAAEAEAAAQAAEAEAQAAAEAAAAKAAEEASAVADETEKGGAFVSGVVESAKSKATAIVDKAKSITPEQMKKVAAGAVGIWGVAAGAGWVMNNLGGAEE